MTTSTPPDAPERRAQRRRFFDLPYDVLFRGLRWSLAHARGFYAAVGVFLVAGTGVMLLGLFAFVVVARRVAEGRTQAFDEAMLNYIHTHRIPGQEVVFREITFLGTGSVVITLVCVAGLFLWLTHHRQSALLLLVSTSGGVLLNSLLKASFNRPRPQLFEWETHALTSSFPSGHAMSATIVYGTVAYLAARLQPERWARWLTMAVFATVIALICASRMVLGVHYPSDILAGVAVGLAWASFCMAALEAIQKLAARRAPVVQARDERIEHEEQAGG